MIAPVWRGSRGSVVLGPTEHRVALYLADRTKAGQVVFPTMELAMALALERSEAYRITARLRVLGLFGIANDRSGQNRGRRWWRTPTERASELDPGRHRTAWSRVVAAAKAKAARIRARLAELAPHKPGTALHPSPASLRPVVDGDVRPPGPAPIPPWAPGRTRPADGADAHPAAPSAPTFAERMRAAGLGGLMDEWRIR